MFKAEKSRVLQSLPQWSVYRELEGHSLPQTFSILNAIVRGVYKWLLNGLVFEDTLLCRIR